MNILADASLPALQEAFPAPFSLTLFHHAQEIAALLPKQDVLFCRSNLKVNQELLKDHSLRYVATASSGTDHCDKTWLTSQNIQLLDAKGCNANAVADYVIACLAYLTQQQHIKGTKAGIIGLGAVGSEVAKRLHAASWHTICYDPLKELLDPQNFQSATLDALYEADFLCIHAELHWDQPYPSAHLVDTHFLNRLNPHCVFINAARGGIINEEALLNTSFKYCTDVYLNEPSIDQRLINKALIATPHIAGHSLEAKYNAVAVISQKLHQIAHHPLPVYEKPKMQQLLPRKKNLSWQDVVLSIYNPINETRALKQATDLKTAFLQLRKNHQQRHDFLLYKLPHHSPQIDFLLGA